MLKAIDDSENIKSLFDLKILCVIQERVQYEEMAKVRKRYAAPLDTFKYEKSSAARGAIKILGHYSDSTTTPVTQSNFTLVRDFVFTQIFIDNANQPGVLVCMTMGGYNNIWMQ